MYWRAPELELELDPTMSMADISHDISHANKKLRREPCEQGFGERLLVKKLSEYATVPTRGSSLAAGYDLHRYVRMSLASSAVHPEQECGTNVLQI